MAEPSPIRAGLTVVDAAALVLGAAVASVHLRGLEREGLTGFGWGLIWVTFLGIAVTASGPLIYLARRLGRAVPGYPARCDWPWIVLGVPWLLTAFLVRQSVSDAALPPGGLLYHGLLGPAVGLSCGIAVCLVFKQWVSPQARARNADRHLSWTESASLTLAISWPIQIGFVLMMMS